MRPLENKKILLITARFFGYETEIQDRLRALGAHVDWFDQRPSNTFISKALIRIDSRFLARTIRQYYARIIAQTANVSYDYVVLISPETITERPLLELKRIQKKARFILYMWDAIKNKNVGIKKLIKHFHERFSFDRDDCANPSYNFRYRPLFFLNEYYQIADHKERTVDLLFIGTIHSDRFNILSSLAESCKRLHLSYSFFMFFPSKVLYWVKVLFDKAVRSVPLHTFKFQSLPKATVLRSVAESKVIVDIQHPNQLGLTMRTIEVLGARRKLITTNSDIVNHDFYHPQNILVIDRKQPNINYGFFQSEMVEIDSDIYRKYSIDGWISEIFNLDKF